MGEAPSNINKDDIAWGSVPAYTEAEFTAMESVGCVFLPAAGSHEWGNTLDNADSVGHYWSATPSESSDIFAYDLGIYDAIVNPVSGYWRKYGLCVRLVSEL